MVATILKSDHVVLHNLSWQQFTNILDDLGENRAVRVAYDQGTLEIMTPLPEHGYYEDVISDIIKEIADELDINYECYGVTTWKRESKLAGVEPDSCFYFQNESIIRGKLSFDLNQDPPPDLALEIDLTNKSLDRFPIYARLGVPEIWCYDSGELKIYQLQENLYIEVINSSIFPQLSIQDIPQIIKDNLPLGRRIIRKVVREWVRKELSR
jgi:Uma2 family endonuclease